MPDIARVVLLIDVSFAAARGFLAGIAQYCSLFGPWRIYREPIAPYKSFTGKQSTLSRIKHYQPDGIILMADTHNPKEIIRMEKPIIIPAELSHLDSNIPTIHSDCPATGKMAAEHLLERGFQHFAYCGFPRVYWSRERQTGFFGTLPRPVMIRIYTSRPGPKKTATGKPNNLISSGGLRPCPNPSG